MRNRLESLNLESSNVDIEKDVLEKRSEIMRKVFLQVTSLFDQNELRRSEVLYILHNIEKNLFLQ